MLSWWRILLRKLIRRPKISLCMDMLFGIDSRLSWSMRRVERFFDGEMCFGIMMGF